jgi:GNAT superfamily N-acetyltransferase
MASRRATHPGALLATTHAVRGGLRVRVRLTRPSDTPAVLRFLEGLSPETRRRRFFAATPAISDGIVRHFTFFDPRERVVVAATSPIDGAEEIVGLADVAHISTGVAELALVVADERQGDGIGALLTEVIASLAAQRGAAYLKAVLLAENRPMAGLMERLGPTVRTTEGGNLAVYVRLPPARRRAA